ncbi:MAG TPA: NAD(P)/FAD-dependent oxidoreductase [Methanobacterium sp.]|nr:NAD(P)/FAD-dependent oxidoreductase [Methanobacterium sp.]
MDDNKTAIIIGAGPAGLTAAYELLDKTDIKPIIYEKTDYIGGLSKTINYNGNRLDIGPHHFYTKSERILNWWTNILPLQGAPEIDDLALDRTVELASQSTTREVGSDKIIRNPAPDPRKEDKVMLKRTRLTRIFFMRKFFAYPVSLNYKTLSNLGIKKTIKIGLSYIKTALRHIEPEKSLEDFFINRFGMELYSTFFKDYTEKVWGVPVDQIATDWGSQRIKGLSITKTVTHALKNSFKRNPSISQKNVETSLAEQFLYPKLGSGQIYMEIARKIVENGGKIHKNHRVNGILTNGDLVTGITVVDESTGEIKEIKGDYFFSTMPVCELINSFKCEIPENVKNVADGLVYRDIIVVGLLLDKLLIKNDTNTPSVNDIVPDHWIYIQERNVKLGRLDVFNNFSPHMVKDENKVWIGLEYFCNEGDELWSMSEKDVIDFAISELTKIDIIHPDDVRDSMVIKEEKSYPAYFGTYHQFNLIKEFVEDYPNLFLIGRNGMHRYNNMDHSMLTAITAVENIIKGETSKENLWLINTEEDYHEEKS